MSLFQNTVLQKYTNNLDEVQLQKLYTKYKLHFHNIVIQENIKKNNEIQYQGEFLIDLFVNILGYTKNPNPNFNLTTEYKNIKDSKKADGAIIINNKAKAIIELKGTNTTNLIEIEPQAFGYKNNQPECDYIIISNYEKLNFYIDNALNPEEFNLFNLSFERFKVLYVCLSYESIEKGLPKIIKNESIGKEIKITKRLYSDYSIFKKEIFENLIELNPNHDKLILFKKTQKLLDRFLFIFFAEDKSLLPINLVRKILKDWKDINDLDEDVSLYSRFKKHFEYLNTGYKGKSYEIFAYNGGLFSPDDLLDNLVVNDQILYKHTLKLSDYNYNEDVDVDILGHIFENSLSEIDEIKAELRNEKIKSKRKSDGVFYTPKFITKYMIQNTIGKLCFEQKNKLSINDSDFVYDKKRKKNITEELLNKLGKYRQWLLQITICDPACGSGAFLNQALDFLILEHRYIDELQSKLFGSSIVFTDFENSILENNLFGVDINEESVEIAKLSLWLRTAKPGRKLSDLSNNIKCGNSIVDKVISGVENIFVWEKEFFEIFSQKNGFDVIIGNPPYGAKFTTLEKEFYKKEYPNSTEGKVDSYRIFIEKSIKITNENGLISLITPNTFLYNLQSLSIRKLIIENTSIYDAVELRKNIFEDAPDVVTVILSLENKKLNDFSFRARVAFHNINYTDINNDSWEIDQQISINHIKSDELFKINLRSNVLFKSINDKVNTYKKLDEFCELRQGTKPYGEKENKMTELLSKIKIDDNWDRAINGRNISRYFIDFENDFVKRSKELHSALPIEIIENEKIYFQRMRKISLFPRIIAAYDNDNIHGLYTCSVITKKNDCKLDLKYILCILNSKLINYWYKFYDTDIEIKLSSMKQIPIPEIEIKDQAIFIEHANELAELNKKYHIKKSSFQRSIIRNFNFTNLPIKIGNWDMLSFSEFLKELKKVKIELSLLQQTEWEDYFIKEKGEINKIKSDIKKMNLNIDDLIFKLYKLDNTEVDILNNLK